MIQDKDIFLDFKTECDDLFESYCERGMVEKPERKPRLYTPGDIARAGNQGDSLADKKTGHKSASSIASRVKRDNTKNQSMGIDETAGISKVADLTRCTIIIKSFKAAPLLLKNLATKLPPFHAKICDKSASTGYCAIHLQGINEQGIPFEVQVHTSETFYLKQITEYEYSHWREFNQAELEAKIQQITDPEQKKEFQERLNAQIQQKKNDDAVCRKAYLDMHSKADARIFEDPPKGAITEVIEAINAREIEGMITEDYSLSPEILKYDSVPPDELEAELKPSKLLTEILPNAQGELITSIEDVLTYLKAAKLDKNSSKSAGDDIMEV